MSESLSPWQSLMKQGLFEEEKFTNEMKKAVLDEVSHRPKRIYGLRSKVAGVIVACLIVGMTFWYGSRAIDGTTQSPSLASSGEGKIIEVPLAFKRLEARNLKRGETILENDPDILPGLSNKYNLLMNVGYADTIPTSDIELIERKEIPGFGTALHYKLKSDAMTEHDAPRNSDYLGFTVDGISPPGTLFHYGMGHMYDRTEMNMTRLFGQDVLKIHQTVCRTDGEACDWYVKKDAGGVFTYFEAEAASYERDLDGDGKEEAIVTTHKQNQIYIFKNRNGQLIWSSIREALKAGQADSIQYDDVTGVFSIHSPGMESSGIKRYYRYATEEDKLEKIGEQKQ